ncbi:hypothetical protein HAX54_009874, partial [Datura stramonium]|nr:hypothetical protein [Datura stramonium]
PVEVETVTTAKGPGRGDQGSKKEEEAEMVLLKAAQTSKETIGEPGVVLDLQRENAQLKTENTALRKQLEDLMQQMLQDQRASNERIDKRNKDEQFICLDVRRNVELLWAVRKRKMERWKLCLEGTKWGSGSQEECGHVFVIVKKGKIDEA